MASIERLFLLVKSLTKSEKRYFRLISELQNGKKEYLILFDFLENHDVMDQNLHNKISEEFPGLKIEPPRKYLYNVLLKSLRQYENQSSIDSKLINFLQDSRILFNKGLVNLSLAKLDKLKKLALKHEKFIYCLMAANQEMYYLIRLQFLGINESDLIKKQQEINTLLEQIAQFVEHSSLYEVLLLRYWNKGMVRSKEEILKLNDLVLEEYSILNRHQINSFESRQLHLNFQSMYFAMIGEPSESIKVYYDLEKLFQENKFLWKDNPLFYINTLDGILGNLRLTKNHEAMEYFMNSLKALKTNSRSHQILIKYKIWGHYLNSLVDSNRLEEASSVAKQFQISLESEFQIIPVILRSWSLFFLARTYYATQQYSIAIKHLNRITNNPLGIRKSQLLVLCRLIKLQIFTLRGEFDYLEYEMRAVERNFLSEKRLYKIEKLVFKIIKRKLVYGPVDDLHEELNFLENNHFNKKIILDLLIEDWIIKLKQT